MPLPPFQHLVDEYWRDVGRLAAGLVGPDEAADCAQRAWLLALAAYPSLTSTRNLRSWLLTITYRCAMDTHRARARRPIPTNALPEAPAVAAPDRDDTVWAAARALPERQRTAIALRYLADLPHSEVAAAMNTTSAATRRLVSDALATLRLEIR